MSKNHLTAHLSTFTNQTASVLEEGGGDLHAGSEFDVYFAPFKLIREEPTGFDRSQSAFGVLEMFCEDVISSVVSLMIFKEIKVGNYLERRQKDFSKDICEKIERLKCRIEMARCMCENVSGFKPLISLVSEVLELNSTIQTIRNVMNCENESIQRLSYWIILIACTMLTDQDEDIGNIVCQCSNNMLNSLNSIETSDVTIIALCQYLVYKQTKDHLLLQDSFIIANYANIIDPIGAEILMASIGEEVIKLYQNYPSLFDSQFVEFVSRRISTANTGRMNDSSIYLNNHEESPKDFTKLFKSEMKFNFYEDVYRFKTTRDIKHCYKAIQSVYCETETHFLDRACRLAHIYQVSDNLETTNDIDFSEILILLCNSLHNFNVIIQSKNSFNIIDSSRWEFCGNTFNVGAFTSVAFNLFNLLLRNQEMINEIMPLNYSNIEFHYNYPFYLLKQITLQLYKMAKSFSKEDKNPNISLLKESCFKGMISNISQFTEILKEEGNKFASDLDFIEKFVEEHNKTLQELVFPEEDCYDFSVLENNLD